MVRQCIVRVVRYGGWSWGPTPRLMVERVLRALPEIIAAHLQASGMHAALESADVELVEPVRLTVRLPMAALEEVGGAQARGRVHVPTARPQRARTAPTSATSVEEVLRPTLPDAPEPPAARPASPADALLDLLVALDARDELASVLGLLPAATRALWWRTLRAGAGPAGERSESAATRRPGAFAERSADAVAPVPLNVLAALDRGAAPELSDRSDAPPELLGAVAAAAAAAGVDVVAAALRLHPPARHAVGEGGDEHAADRGLRVVEEPGARGGRSACGDEGAYGRADAGSPHGVRGRPGAAREPGPRPDVHTDPGSVGLPAPPSVDGGGLRPGSRGRPGTARSAARPGPVEICSALPFLLLYPLSRLGYLKALEPAFAATEPDPRRRADALTTFATALGYTVLGPLQRGWRRAREDVAAATAFAGVDPPVPGPRLDELARTAEPAMQALNAVLGSAVARGHPPGRPLLLAGAGGRAGGGLLLAEVDGLFPVVWADRTAELLPAWRACGSPAVLARPAGLPVDVLRHLDEAGVSFIVDVPPTRSEHWRRLPTRSRLWTNDMGLAMGALVAQTGGFADAADRLDDLVHALAVVRQAAPLATGEALRRGMLLAAAVALGTIAWTLWRSREPTDPLLTLERFSDLSARVSEDGPALLVRIPLGSRHADLLARGLLADVVDVPWLPGRVVRISGG